MMIALDLECIVLEAMEATTTVVSSVESATATIENGIDFAFLDIDVLDGDTFGLAKELNEQGIPFTFVSGQNHARLPEWSKAQPFIPKPFMPVAIAHALKQHV
jgi:DNA-binding NtrC family response regulator